LTLPKIRRLATWLALGVFPFQAEAQTTLDSEILRRQQQKEAEERQAQQQSPNVHIPSAALADADASDLPEESPCFLIKELRLEGDRTATFSWLHSKLNDYQNRCIGREGAALIVKRLTAALIDRGFTTTRIGLPEQNLSTGVLRLVLVPGILHAIKFTNDEAAGDWHSAFPIRPGDILNLRDIEQGLEQMKRVPSQEVDFKIIPGDAAGESDILITVKRTRPWRIGLTYDDSGSQSTGKLQSSISLSLDNPLGINDLLNLSFNADAEHEPGKYGTEGKSLQYSIPWGYWTVSLQGSEYQYHQRIQGVNQTFVSQGTTESQEFKVQRLVHRDQTSKTSLQLRLSRRAQRNFLDDVEIQVQRRTTAAVEIGVIHQQSFGNTQITATLAHKEGVPWFGGAGDPSGRAASSPTNLYRMETADIALQTPFVLADIPFRLNNALRAQYTSAPLYTTEQISIGGRYSVRGFSGETTLTAERGYYLRNEIEVPLANTGQAIWWAVDWGKVSGPSAKSLVGTILAGTALGLRGNILGMSYEAFVGQALRYPDGFHVDDTVTGFQLSYLF
jgi:hemolysin activation/secretion protein